MSTPPVARVDIPRCHHCANVRLQIVAALAPLRPALMSRLATGPPP